MRTVSEPTAGPATTTAAWRDDRRAWWTLPLFIAVSPIAGIALAHTTGHEAWTWCTAVLFYVILPVADVVGGRDARNPPQAAAGALEDDPYYRYLVYASVPLFYLTWLAGAWAVAAADLSWFGDLGVALSVSLTNGLALVVGHELGHKPRAIERRLAQIVLAVPAYGHFTAEHNAGHHRDVATPEDPASARFGEPLYRFVLREIPGALRRAWRTERERLARGGRSAWSARNGILQSFALTALLYGTGFALFGPAILPYVLISTLWGWQFLSTANYVEHYGLLRRRLPDGRYERVRPEHSWNSDHSVSNLVLYHLQRHCDHHARPTCRYQALRSDAAPELPAGYPGSFLLAYVPPLWRAVMDARVLAVYGGDITRVNVDPALRARRPRAPPD